MIEVILFGKTWIDRSFRISLAIYLPKVFREIFIVENDYIISFIWSSFSSKGVMCFY